MVRHNRDILTGGKNYAQRQAKKHLVDEVTFDKEKRHEYLTGFHKRKLQRQKKAQEYNKEQERLAKIAERKELRDERKRDLENQLAEFKEKAKEIAAINGDLAVSDDEEEEEEEEGEEVKGERIETGENDETGEWNGFNEGEAEANGETKSSNGSLSRPVKGILHHTEVYDPVGNGGNVLLDDETTVTIESIENPNFSNVPLKEVAKANRVDLEKSEEILEKSIKRAKDYAVLCGVAKPTKEKKPKKKFRYLSKAERRENTRKEKMKGKLRGKK